MKSTHSLANLSERQLLHRFGDLVRQDRRLTAQLLATIAEIDERKLWAKHACPSMFAFCVERFHMSESMTAKRIWAARTARRFPVILQMVARGELHLSAIVKIARHLTDNNHRAVLARARHKNSRELDLLVAELAPRPDVPSRIRALPRSTGTAVGSSGGLGSECTRGAKSADACTTHGSECTTESKLAGTCATHGSERTTKSNPAGACMTHGPERTMDSNPAGACATHGTEQAVESVSTIVPNAPNSPSAPSATRPRGRIVPLAPRRYKIEITVDQQTHDKLRMLQDLLVMVLHAARALAAMPLLIDKRAATPVTSPYLTSDRRRDGACSVLATSSAASIAAARSVGDCRFLLERIVE